MVSRSNRPIECIVVSLSTCRRLGASAPSLTDLMKGPTPMLVPTSKVQKRKTTEGPVLKTYSKKVKSSTIAAEPSSAVGGPSSDVGASLANLNQETTEASYPPIAQVSYNACLIFLSPIHILKIFKSHTHLGIR